MRITFNIPEFTRNERNSHCDVLHIAPVRVANLVLDDAIAAIQTSRPTFSTLNNLLYLIQKAQISIGGVRKHVQGTFI